MIPEKNPYLKFIIIAWAILMPLGVISIVLGLYVIKSIGGFFLILGINILIAWIGLIATYSSKSIIHKKIFKNENLIAKWKFSPEDWNQYDGKEFGSILITTGGVYINKKMIPWREHMYFVKDIYIESKVHKGQPERLYIILDYLLRGRTRRIYHLVHIPIPHDKQQEAEEVVGKLKEVIL